MPSEEVVRRRLLENVSAVEWGIVAWALLSSLLLVARPFDLAKSPFAGYVVQFVPAMAASLACLYASSRQQKRGEQLGWAFLGFGVGCMAASNAVSGILSNSPDFRSYWTPIAIIYGLGYPLLYAGVLIHAFLPIRHLPKPSLFLDSAAVTITASIAGAYLLDLWQLWPASMAAGTTPHHAILFPLLDLGILFCLVLILLSAPATLLHPAPLLILVAAVLYTSADLAMAFLSWRGEYAIGMRSDIGYVWAGVAVTIAAMQDWRPRRKPDQGVQLESAMKVPGQNQATEPSVPTRGGYLPYVHLLVTTLLISGFLMHRRFTVPSLGFGRIEETILVAVPVVGAIIVLRSLFLMLDNAHLYQSLQNFSKELESRVRQRTAELAGRNRELTALNAIVSTGEAALDPSEVLSKGIDVIRSALDCDFAAVWIEKPSHELGLAASVGLPNETPPSLRLLDPSMPSLLRVGTSADPVIMSGAEALRAGFPASLPPSIGHVAVASLNSNCQSGGVLAIGNRTERALSLEDLKLLHSSSAALGIAFTKATLYHEVKQQVDLDSLTTLFNHRYLHERLDAEIQRALRQNHKLAVAMLDIDNFKLFNDTYGHPAGDRVLRHVASILRGSCRAVDVVGRYGGDEFMVILLECGAQEAEAVANRILGRLEDQGFPVVPFSERIPIQLSIGIAICPDDSVDNREIISMADGAMYRSKFAGGGRVGLAGMIQHESQPWILRDTGFPILECLIAAIDNKDHYTRQHCEAVARYALLIADELSLSDEAKSILRYAGLFHDVGKIGIPDEILHKPGPLETHEVEVMQQHSLLGSLIAQEIAPLLNVSNLILHHHEHYDGSGYLHGIKGEAIPYLARIIAVADSFSAMTSNRPYRRALPVEMALEELRSKSGSQFDPEIIDVFLRSAAPKSMICGAKGVQ
ncbi:MAG: diguanylate cyclase [Chloroflexi bacterium]|nr:diguanylate cyclase [Chloroflexota bacterium]